MKKFNYIIVDDEPNAIKLLQKNLEEHYDNLHLKGSYTCANDALDIIKTEHLHLIFLDISMPHKSGLELLGELPELNAEVIFITAHEEFALTAFNFAPSGYILKPINKTKLYNAIDKALQRVHDKQNTTNYPPQLATKQNSKIGIKNNKGIDYVNIEDILFMEATSRYTKIVTMKKVYLSSFNIGKLKHLVEAFSFYNVHRSFIVNLDKIIRYDSSGIIIMEGGYEIPISKNVREDFLRLFQKG